MNRALVAVGAVAVVVVVAWALARDATSSPWEPTRELDQSVVAAVDRFLELAYGRRDCAAADELLDEPSAFVEQFQCRAGESPAGHTWTRPSLVQGCQEEPGIYESSIDGHKFSELGPFDCVETVLTSVTCAPDRAVGTTPMRIYLARRAGQWRISHVEVQSVSIRSGGGRRCSAAERSRLRAVKG